MTSETFLPQMGGAEIHLKNLQHFLTQNGHRVTLLTNQADAGTVQKDLAGLTIIAIPWSRKNLITIIRSLWNSAGEADIIHAHYSYRLAAFAGIVGLLRRVPVIVTLHGLGTLNEAGAQFPYKQVHALYRFVSLQLATRIISTSEDLAVVARRYVTGKKIIVIPNGYDNELFNPEHTVPESLKAQFVGHRVILTVRRLVPKNGIHYLIEAMPFILAKYSDAQCFCIGDGRMRSYIESRIDALDLRKSVILAGAMDNSLVPDYLALADVVVFPSTAESASIACAEAMGSGAPVVASRVGGLIELLGNDSSRGRLVTLVDWTESNYDAPMTLPIERYRALADAICEALEQGPNDTHTAAGILYAQQELAWPVVVKKTEAQYVNLIQT